MGTPPIPARIHGNQNGVEITGCACSTQPRLQLIKKHEELEAPELRRLAKLSKVANGNITMERVHEHHPH